MPQMPAVVAGLQVTQNSKIYEGSTRSRSFISSRSSGLRRSIFNAENSFHEEPRKTRPGCAPGPAPWMLRAAFVAGFVAYEASSASALSLPTPVQPISPSFRLEHPAAGL